MYVYCMFCETQRCKVIAKLMEIRGALRSFSPQIVRRQRKKGVNREVLFDLLPGYVFVFSEERMVDYTQFFGMDGVIRRVGKQDTGYELAGSRRLRSRFRHETLREGRSRRLHENLQHRG